MMAIAIASLLLCVVLAIAVAVLLPDVAQQKRAKRLRARAAYLVDHEFMRPDDAPR